MTNVHTYEALVIFKPVLDNEYAEGVLKSFENLIKNNKGKIIKSEKLGRRRLAYDIAKFKDGFMVQFFLELPPEAIVKLRRACQINEDILRISMLTISAEQLELALSGRGGPPRREERPAEGGGDRGGFRGGPREGGFRGGDREGGFRGGPREGGFRGGDRGPRPPFDGDRRPRVAPGAAPAAPATE
jgi:small subunit ribosomal protein S6